METTSQLIGIIGISLVVISVVAEIIIGRK
jgi:hypothetical protein